MSRSDRELINAVLSDLEMAIERDDEKKRRTAVINLLRVAMRDLNRIGDAAEAGRT